MEPNVVSLQDKIGRAEKYHRDLCDHLDDQRCRLSAILVELYGVQKTIDTLYDAIISSTRNSHVGAPQAVTAIRYAAGYLDTVYELLGSDIRYTSINGSIGAVTDRTIHVTPGLAAKQKRLTELAGQVASFGINMKEYVRCFDAEGLSSADLAQFQARAETVCERISILSRFIGLMTDYLFEADRLYGEAQVNAIARANQIPY